MAIRKIVNRANKSRNYILSAPLGGLNARDSLDSMPETDAIVMDNYIPGETKISLRKGFSRFALIGQPVRTLVEFRAENGLNRFFAFAAKKHISHFGDVRHDCRRRAAGSDSAF